jgi:hypothetical protein
MLLAELSSLALWRSIAVEDLLDLMGDDSSASGIRGEIRGDETLHLEETTLYEEDGDEVPPTSLRTLRRGTTSKGGDVYAVGRDDTLLFFFVVVLDAPPPENIERRYSKQS